jgi:hypothetical protein
VGASGSAGGGFGRWSSQLGGEVEGLLPTLEAEVAEEGLQLHDERLPFLEDGVVAPLLVFTGQSIAST